MKKLLPLTVITVFLQGCNPQDLSSLVKPDTSYTHNSSVERDIKLYADGTEFDILKELDPKNSASPNALSKKSTLFQLSTFEPYSVEVQQGLKTQMTVNMSKAQKKKKLYSEALDQIYIAPDHSESNCVGLYVSDISEKRVTKGMFQTQGAAIDYGCIQETKQPSNKKLFQNLMAMTSKPSKLMDSNMELTDYNNPTYNFNNNQAYLYLVENKNTDVSKLVLQHIRDQSKGNVTARDFLVYPENERSIVTVYPPYAAKYMDWYVDSLIQAKNKDQLFEVHKNMAFYYQRLDGRIFTDEKLAMFKLLDKIYEHIHLN